MYLTQALHRTLQQHPDRAAIRAGAVVRSYREFADRVARLAGALQQLGMHSGDRVAMLALNSDRYMEYQFAVPWGGGALNPCNIRWSAAEILYSLDDCESTHPVRRRHLQGAWPKACARQAKTLRQVIYCGRRRDAGRHARRRGADRRRRTGARCRAPRRRPGRRVLHRRHHRLSQGRDAQPHQHGSSRLALHAEGTAPAGSCYLHAAPMFHLADMGIAVAHWIEGNTHSLRAGLQPRGGAAGHRARPRQPRAAGADDDPDAGRPSGDARRHATWAACARCSMAPHRSPRPCSTAPWPRCPSVEFTQAYGMTELSPLATLIPPYWYHTPEGAERRQAALGRARQLLRPRCRSSTPTTAKCRAARWARWRCAARTSCSATGTSPSRAPSALRGGWMHTGDGALHGRRRLHLRRRPHEGHDHQRRRERLLGRGGERARAAPGRGGLRGDRHPRASSGARRCMRWWCSSPGPRPPMRPSSSTARRRSRTTSARAAWSSWRSCRCRAPARC